jgi:hypothetical protein
MLVWRGEGVVGWGRGGEEKGWVGDSTQRSFELLMSVKQKVASFYDTWCKHPPFLDKFPRKSAAHF